MTPNWAWLGKACQPRQKKKRRADGGVHGVHHVLPGRASHPWPDASHLTVRRWNIDGIAVRTATEREVEVCIQSEPIGIWQQIGPRSEATDTVANRDIRTLAFANTRDFTYHPVNFQVADYRASTEDGCRVKNEDAQGCQGFPSNDPNQSLVDNTKHRDDAGVLRLADELREDSNVVERSLGVRVSHRTIQKVEGAFLSRVIESCELTPSGF